MIFLHRFLILFNSWLWYLLLYSVCILDMCMWCTPWTIIIKRKKSFRNSSFHRLYLAFRPESQLLNFLFMHSFQICYRETSNGLSGSFAFALFHFRFSFPCFLCLWPPSIRPPLLSLIDAMLHSNKAIKWIKKEEETINRTHTISWIQDDLPKQTLSHNRRTKNQRKKKHIKLPADGANWREEWRKKKTEFIIAEEKKGKRRRDFFYCATVPKLNWWCLCSQCVQCINVSVWRCIFMFISLSHNV